MIPINPISGAALPAAQVQQQLATDKTRQVRRQQAAQRNIASASDHFEHAVENAEADTPIHDEQRQANDRRRGQRGRKPNAKPSEQEPPHIDLVG